MTKRTRAIAVVTQLGTQQCGALSAQVLSEFVVTVTRKITPPGDSLTAAYTQRKRWAGTAIGASPVPDQEWRGSCIYFRSM